MINILNWFLLIACILYFVCAKCCIYTAIILFVVLSSIGMTPEYCVGHVKEIDGENHYHSWIRINSYNIEQSTLNLHHYDTVNYDSPVVMFKDTKSFIDRVDMWSPLK